jgi:tungstate transport system ATP-binding protein
MSINMQLLDIQKSYKSTKALNSVSLTLEGNKITVFLGINGAGKTTLMRIMAGLEDPTDGKIQYNKQDIDAKTLRKDATLVFQKTAMFSMNVYDNLAYGLKIRNIPEAEIASKIEGALCDVRLSGFEKRKAKKLSGGEQQRVALARAFLLDSKILLLDEPTANLDPNSAAIIEKAIVNRKSSQKIIVLSTHNLSQAKRLGDEIVHIYNGEVVETAKPQDFFENPKNEVTRKFINGELEF